MLVYRKKHNDSINYYDYYLKDESQELKIIFGGNGDLYFCSKSFVECQEAEFYITKENMIIYNLFSELFKAFQNVEIYTINDFDPNIMMMKKNYNKNMIVTKNGMKN